MYQRLNHLCAEAGLIMAYQHIYNYHIGKTLLKVIILLLTAFMPLWAEGQTYMEKFGQNRIQTRKYAWKYFDTKHFRIYHYDLAGRQLGRYVAEEAEQDIILIEKRLEGRFPSRFNIVLYNSYSEYRETNIGLKNESQILENSPAGQVNIVEDKLIVYFTGIHTDLRRQIRAGMAQIVMQRMIFGESFRKMAKSALQLNLPQWVTEGYIAYLVDGWDTKSNSEWKNLLDARPKAGFFELAEQYPELAGKAFWKFVSDQYGDESVKNLLITLQQKTSLNQGMMQRETLNMKVKKAYDSCIHYYKDVFAQDAATRELPDSSKGLIDLQVPTDNTIVRNVRVSPRGHDVAYVTWKDGEYKVYIQHTQKEQERSVILDGGRQDYNEQPDPNYPMLAWSNNGYKLAIVYKKGPETRIRIYNSLKAKIENYIIPSNRFDRLLGMSFMEEDDKLVFSAIKRSQTDLYMFTIRGSRMVNITNDAWDDVQPFFVSGGSRRGILFLSNRPEPNLNVPLDVNELPTGPMNVFFYDTKTKRSELLQCSDVTAGNITQPIQYGSDNMAFLYDSNGVYNKYVVMFGRSSRNYDSAYAVPITNYSQNIISHQYNPASNEVADVIQVGNKYKVYWGPLELPGLHVQPKILTPTILSRSNNPQSVNDSVIGTSVVRNYNTGEVTVKPSKIPVINGGNTFQSEFADEPPVVQVTNPAPDTANVLPSSTESIAVIDTVADAADTSRLTEVNDSTYLKMKPSAYRLSFKPDFFTVRLDNSLLFSQYQSFQNTGGRYTNPSLSGLITASLNDLMENHRFTAGFQLPINFSGSTYFLQYENFSRRIDWGLMYLRTQNIYNYLVTYVDASNRPILQKEQPGKNVTNMLQGYVSYPLDRIRSIRFTTALRQDQITFKAIDTLSLSFDVPNRSKYWSLSRLEFVFDNTINPAINIHNGFRYKFYVEYMYGLNQGNPNCYNLGLDFRYYKKIYKNFIFATRFAAAHSDGNSQVVYFLGGVDNWINPKYSDYVPVNGNYGFQTLATNLRGYAQNARNGNNFMVLNSEFRLPVLTTFIKRPIQSALLKNLQAVTFLDMGSAWKGFLPNADNTKANYFFPSGGIYNPNNPNNITLQLSVPGTGGLAVGYGAGLRTTIFGYFLRADAAWSLENRNKPIWYFSMGTDF